MTSIPRRVRILAPKLLLTVRLLLACACGGGAGGTTTVPTAPPTPTTPPPPPTPTTAAFTGFVGDGERENAPISGAVVTVAGVSATTTPDGRFALPSVTIGSYPLTIAASGFDTLAQNFSIQTGNNFRTFKLTPVNTFFPSGKTLVYLPPGTSTVRGVFLPIYGGTSDSRPLILGDLAFYQNLPPSGDVDAYRSALKAFARENGFALMGIKTPGGGGFDTGASVSADILQGLLDASIASKHPELADANLLLQGMSTGACFVDMIVPVIPNRIIGFISMKSGCSGTFTAGSGALSVPGYFFIGGADLSEINVPVTNDFDQNRARGAPWAFAIERGAGHVWVADNALIFHWAAEVAAQRLPTTITPGSPVALRPVGESAGWLGDRTSFSIAGYPCFPGDKGRASWLPSQQTARDWQAMMGSTTTMLVCQ
jgi:dienelactone hydrolase